MSRIIYIYKLRLLREILSIIWWYKVKVNGNCGEKESQGTHRGPKDFLSYVH